MANPKILELYFAIKSKNYQLIKDILRNGCNIDARFRDSTALSVAILSDDVEIVDILLEGGANPDLRSRDPSGRLEPPIVSACRKGNFKIVQLLLVWSADINATDFYGHTALWVACKHLYIEIIDLLLENGAGPRTPSLWSECPLYATTKEMETSVQTRETIAKKLILAGFRSKCKDKLGRDAFYWSVLNGSNKTAILILRSGYRPTRKIINENEQLFTKMSLDFLELLVDTVENIPSLLELSKLVVCDRVQSTTERRQIRALISNLELPRTLVRYLLKDPFDV
ncbi:putative ankyrin repeat protein RBE_0220 [Artemia franciscana]|uniref:Uncharacterized protein n=1 Tax=Artemia franciscana TaxID=6661 RepID=A0AA88KRX8_ARTSF|nr:hypothetical protein QYM36_017757 [Artemia franciscana]KAK2703814.1 hypothetical protein QYM36_017757 [Artemia franciscana]